MVNIKLDINLFQYLLTKSPTSPIVLTRSELKDLSCWLLPVEKNQQLVHVYLMNQRSAPLGGYLTTPLHRVLCIQHHHNYIIIRHLESLLYVYH